MGKYISVDNKILTNSQGQAIYEPDLDSENILQNHTILGVPGSAVPGVPYTAGNGIDITNDEISIDETVVATKTDLADYTPTASLADVATTGAYSDLSGAPTLANVATSGDYDDLTNKPSIPAAQIQADYNQADNTKLDFIKNKPDLSGFITKNVDDLANYTKSTDLAAVALSNSYTSLDDKPAIPDAQIQSDWNQADNTKKDFIKNKPTVPTTVAELSDASSYLTTSTAASTYEAKFTDGSATIASLDSSTGVVTLKAGVNQSSGAIANASGSDITVYSKAQVDTILTNHVQYLGVVADATELAALAPTKTGDWARASAQFSYSTETVHVGDILVCDALTPSIIYDVVHTENDSNTWRPITIDGTALGSSESLSLAAGTGVSITGSAGAYTISASGSGAVDSVNGATGTVVLDADDISDTSTTAKFTNATEKATWNGKQNAIQIIDLTDATPVV